MCGKGDGWYLPRILRPAVAPQMWCKCRGRKLRLLMLRGGCDDFADHLFLGAPSWRAEQLVA